MKGVDVLNFSINLKSLKNEKCLIITMLASAILRKKKGGAPECLSWLNS